MEGSKYIKNFFLSNKDRSLAIFIEILISQLTDIKTSLLQIIAIYPFYNSYIVYYI